MGEILVIGCGLAGMSAAVRAAEMGQHVTMVAPQPSERVQSVMAMGGTNAALDTKGEGDSTELHFQETMKGGCDLADPEAVRRLTTDAPAVIDWLSRIGMNFTRDANGMPDVRAFGGQSKMRTTYAGARTGKQLITALTARTRRYEASGAIMRLTGPRLLALVRDGDGVGVGAVFLDERTGELRAFPADAIVLATGAPNGIYGKTTGSVTDDGSASGIALRDGLAFANLEMVQFHPTTVAAGNKRMLISEAARGQGGRLYAMRDGKPWYFMEEWHPERGALMPRDVVSRSIYRVVHDLGLTHDGRDEVLLDISHLPATMIERDLDEVLETCLTYLKLDPRVEPIPVYPGVHYFMGGILTDASHHTDAERIFAAGECSCQYHGANRLGGNSTLGAIHGGLVSAQEAAALDPYPDVDHRTRLCDAALAHEQAALDTWGNGAADGPRSRDIKTRMAEVMHRSMGIYRDAPTLETAQGELEELATRCEAIGTSEGYYDLVSTRESLRVARAMVSSALERRESRGAHQRLDYPETDDAFRRNCIALWTDAGLEVAMR